MPETIPADITAAIDIFHTRALRQGSRGIGTVATAEAEKAATDARNRLERVIAAHLRGYREMKAALEVQTSGGA